MTTPKPEKHLDSCVNELECNCPTPQPEGVKRITKLEESDIAEPDMRVEIPKSSSWEDRFDEIYKCNCLLCQEDEHKFTTTVEDMKSFISQTLSEYRKKLMVEILETSLHGNFDITTVKLCEFGYNQAKSDILDLLINNENK